jgi:hypothetical protein
MAQVCAWEAAGALAEPDMLLGVPCPLVTPESRAGWGREEREVEVHPETQLAPVAILTAPATPAFTVSEDRLRWRWSRRSARASTFPVRTRANTWNGQSNLWETGCAFV